MLNRHAISDADWDRIEVLVPERIPTVVGTLRLQKRNALEFLSRCIAARRAGATGPRLCMG